MCTTIINIIKTFCEACLHDLEPVVYDGKAMQRFLLFSQEAYYEEFWSCLEVGKVILRASQLFYILKRALLQLKRVLLYILNEFHQVLS